MIQSYCLRGEIRMTQLPATLSGTFSADQVALIKRTICKEGSDDELKLFIAQCERTGLDPFSKQIYAIFRWDSKVGRNVMTIQTGVDGFRVIAGRNGQYAGQLGPMWCGVDGEWKDVWTSHEPPVAAKVGVLRHDFKSALWGTARFDAYASRGKDGKLTSFWAKMPELMIGKVAECLALRRAFPQELSGLYSAEEMKDGQEGSSATLSGQVKGRTSTQTEMASSDQDAEAEISRPNQIGSSGNQNPNVRRGAPTISVNLPTETGSPKGSSVAAERVLGGDELSGTSEVVYPTPEEEASAKETLSTTELEAPITKRALLTFLETAVSNGYTEEEASDFLQTFEVEERGKLVPVTEENVLKLQNKHLDLALTMKFGEKKQ
jgi:phage recombination protein Bet